MDQKQSVIERLQQANNILVTVSNNPSVDQLAACIGLTLALNKMGKHATAVFSGQVPSTIEFLQPERTIEKNTDSLRDFIIALDKAKADKLRYKVEDKMVKIFITPYRTSISDKDLEFSQGDFNVDVVLAIGVHAQNDLDQAITAHGRILHDATVMTVNVNPGGELGSVNWLDAGASSLSELGVVLVNTLDNKLMDGQISTAFLTGIVAETERFSNSKTSPQTMSISAELMSAGANQQLVATKLEEPVVVPEPPKPEAPAAPEAKKEQTPPPTPPKPDDGTIEIEHDAAPAQPLSLPPVEPAPEDSQAPQIHIDEQGRLHPLESQQTPELPEPPKPAEAEPELPKITPLPSVRHEENSKLLTDKEPPLLGNSPLTANIVGDDEDEPSTDPLSLPSVGLLNREPLPSQQSGQEKAPSKKGLTIVPPSEQPAPVLPPTPAMPMPGSQVAPTMPSLASPGATPANPQPFTPDAGPAKTLSQIEQDVHSPHIEDTTSPFSIPDQPLPQPAVPNLAPMAPAAQPAAPVTPTPAPAAASDNGLDAARNAVEAAINSNANAAPEPIQALNAQPLSFGSIHDQPAGDAATQPTPVAPAATPSFAPTAPQPVSFEPTAPTTPGQPGGSATPPPVPPPMMPPTFPAS